MADKNTSTNETAGTQQGGAPDAFGALIESQAPAQGAAASETEQRAKADAAKDAAFLNTGGADKASTNAGKAARDYIEGTTTGDRDRAGRFTGRKTESSATEIDADHSNPAEQDDDDERNEEDEDSRSSRRGEDDDDAGDDADTDEDAAEDEDDDDFEDMAKLADELDGLEDEETDSPARRPAGSARGNATDQPALSPKDEKGAKVEDAAGADEDDDEKPISKEELAEILDSEGRSAWLNAKQYNLRLKERKEAREAKKAEQASKEADGKAQERARFEAEAKKARKRVETEVLPAFDKAIETAPALRAIYGKAGTKIGDFTERQINARASIVTDARKRMEKAEKAGKPITLRKAISITLAKEHADEFTRQDEVRDRTEQAVVSRHNRKSVSPSAGGSARRTSSDPTKQAQSIAGQFIAGRK